MFLHWFRSNRFYGLFFVFVLSTFVSVPAIAQDMSIGLALVAEGLTAPIDLDAGPDGRLFVSDQTGVVYIVDQSGQMMAEPFLDIRDRMVELSPDYDERGLLGLAFHPDFANNGKFYVFYSAPLRADAPAGYNCTNVLSEFTVSADNPNAADPNTERILFMIDKPQMNHNGGDITFGPDGFLYLPLGDGGGANDVDEGHTPDIGNGQDISNLLGSILRLDVNSGDPYGIPADNPFADGASAPPETYAYGFRNPWRISFDDNGQLFAADAGQNLYEEVDMVQAGGNYGWNIKEGAHCFDPANPDTAPAECATAGPAGEPLIDPIIEIGHDMGEVIVGGGTYRGSVAELAGQYIFATWGLEEDTPSGLLFAAPPSMTTTWTFTPLSIANNPDGSLGVYVLAVRSAADNETYVLTSSEAGPTGTTGQVWRLVPADQAGPALGAGGGEQAEGGEESAATEEAAPAQSGGGLDGNALVDERCTVCHDRGRIDSKDKDEAGWTETVDRMIGYGAQLNADERQAVIDYLVATH